ncbi:MAG TPA: c-type cytochrome [Burkholderiaceae bacterium]|nr:c-type cytochrome [Burkholderiaceae bacterium]
MNPALAGRWFRFAAVAGLVAAGAMALAPRLAGAAEDAAATPATPKVDIAKGQQIASSVCAACHNADGNSTIAQNPRLAGQPAAYLYKQLVDLSRKPDDKMRRENAVMSAFAGQLSDEDKRNVAAYFASQAPKLDAAQNKDTANDAQQIYRTGIAERRVPACAGCHGPAGAGLPVLFPRIGGQHADYTEAQLKAFRDGTRRNNDAMMTIAQRLRDPEMKELADYVAGLRRQP